MINLDIYGLLLRGDFFSFNKETSESDIIEKFGEPTDIEDYGRNGKYFHYNDLRLSIMRGKLNAAELLLRNSENDYIFKDEEENIVINGNTSLLSMIGLFNYLGLKWDIPTNNQNWNT